MSRSTRLVALALLRRRPGQAVLVGLVLAASALLLVTSLVVLRSLDEPFEAMYERQRASHLLLEVDSRLYDPEALAAWWSAREGIDGVTPVLPAVVVGEGAVHDGEELGTALWLVEHPPEEARQDLLAVVAGSAAPWPAEGEVWIPTSLAHAHGLEVGDVLEVPVPAGQVPLRIGAVVVDPQFSNRFTTPVRVWLAPGALVAHFPLSRLDGAMIGVRYADPTLDEAHWAAFNEHLGGAFSGLALRYELIAAAWLGLSRFLGGLLLAFGGVALAVALLVVHTTLRGAVLADFRLIGVLRAVGFTPADVVRVYLGQVVALSALALPVGLGLGFLASDLAQELLLRALGAGAPAGLFGQAAVLTSTLVLGAVLLTVLHASRHAARVPPSQAVRHGAPPEPSGRPRLAWTRRLPLPAWLAVRGLIRQPLRTALSLLGVVAATFSLLLGLTVLHGFASMGDDLGSWGYDGSEVRVLYTGKRATMTPTRLVRELRQTPGVTGVLVVDHLVEGAVPAGEGHPARTLFGSMSDDFGAAGFQVLRGRHPVRPGEVALAIHTAWDYDAEPGDAFALVVGGERRVLEVVGVYQSVQNMGQGFRIHESLLLDADPLYRPHAWGLRLASGVDRDALLTDLEARLGEVVDAQPGDRFVRSIIRGLVTSMGLAFALMAALLLVLTGLAMANATLMDAREQRRSLGVLRTLGLTPGQLRGVQALQASLGALAGVSVGALAWAAGTPPILASMFSGLGVTAFPARLPLSGPLAVLLGVVAICALSAWLAARHASLAAVRGLVTEG